MGKIMQDNYELDWLAFRYIADEMTDDERSSFESQLADNQPAREAVSRAVELTQAIALNETLTQHPPVATATSSSTWLRSAVWMAAGAVASLLLIAAFQSPLFHRGQPDNAPDIDHSQQLAIAWSETVSDWNTDPLAETDTFETEPLDRQIAELETLTDQDEDDIAAPQWMLLAVEASIEEEMSEDRNPNID